MHAVTRIRQLIRSIYEDVVKNLCLELRHYSSLSKAKNLHSDAQKRLQTLLRYVPLDAGA